MGWKYTARLAAGGLHMHAGRHLPPDWRPHVALAKCGVHGGSAGLPAAGNHASSTQVARSMAQTAHQVQEAEADTTATASAGPRRTRRCKACMHSLQASPPLALTSAPSDPARPRMRAPSSSGPFTQGPTRPSDPLCLAAVRLCGCGCVGLRSRASRASASESHGPCQTAAPVPLPG